MGRWAFVVVFLACSVARAASPPYHGVFIHDGQIDLTVLLPAPPQPGSAAALAELSEMMEIQKTRTPEMVAEARSDLKEDVWTFAGRLLGPRFSREALPVTATLFDGVVNDQEVFTYAPKRAFARKRPFLVDSELKPVVPMPDTPSYPSNHSTVAHLMAIVLSTELPEYKEALFARADVFAQMRVVGGVHFPSDIEAGKTVSAALAAVMMNDGEFKRQLAASRAELRRALDLH